MDGKGQNFFLRNLGWPYEKLKRRVLFLLLFLFRVNTKLQQLKSVKLSKLSFLYRMVNQDCILVCTTVSEHSFLSKEASFVNLKNDFPVFFALSKEQLTLE